MRRFRPLVIGKRGQTAVEYMLTTVVLSLAFAGMYGFMQQNLKKLYTQAAKAILKTYTAS